jgi:hypothetical protein
MRIEKISSRPVGDEKKESKLSENLKGVIGLNQILKVLTPTLLPWFTMAGDIPSYCR